MPVVRQGRPPDGGWGWMVIAGAFLTLFVLAVFSLGYSILFSEFLMSHGASSATIAWIFNLHVFLWNAVGVFTGPLTKEMGFRKVSMIATFLASISLFFLVFADSIWYLLVFYALAGLFGGLGAKPCYLLLTLYFDRKRGRANAFLMSGVCSAQFVGPLLIRYLLAEYSLKGATLIISGIVFNSLVGTALYQPVEWHLKKDEEEDSLKDELTGDKELGEADPDAGVTDEMRSREALRRKKFGESLSRRPSEMSMLSLAVSNIDLSSIPPSSRRASFSLETTDGEDAGGFLTATARVVRTVVADFKVLKSLRALIIVMGGVFTVSAYLNFLMMAPFAIQHLGYSLSEAAWCMSMAAIANFAARLVTSGLSDQAWFNIRYAYMSGAIIISFTTAVFGFLQDLTHIQVAMAVWGCGVGINISLIVLLMPHFMGAEKTPAVFGVHSLFLSFSLITIGPIFGLVRDWSKSYTVTMLVMGITAGLSVLLWCLMPAAIAHDKRIEEEQGRKEQEEAERKV
ncbi:monocarboxylate transporter 9-like [Portunus trituberculatus]|uniref:monocarboxylate transporter 9-like n=1 Tax=Portunus trituberculatus TaxID=210409 RepID=UPI001E1D12E5|nr:monocarboxylate transporter 9-like [Portunus trituberculatus]XP_045126442.1 monocarboxylate transporter 9-like [Portunus trituberculatus]XP_045126443.1 monocarboxylate transporter 9-like [Portunus trituberculatus]XP_045126444.1 monocarboxylate transporter 9-like [Portunus trituberculatus]XP_045126445.1 monocarboxylate transporter 9-like [Portunus trituberculatus]XP_045126446.1 monocarboxylate transporter 9-like [Portunus trituberculatus]